MATLIDRNAKGVYPISVTPFLDNGSVDLESMDRLTDFFLSCQVPGMTLLGVLGEANKLSAAESMALLQRVLKRAAGRMQVIVGVSHVGLDNFADFTQQVMQAGASGIMVTPTTGLKTEDQVLNYFEGLMGRIGQVPMALQDYPQNSGVFMSVDTIGKLLVRHDNIKILKHEEGSALRKVSKLRLQESSGCHGQATIRLAPGWTAASTTLQEEPADASSAWRENEIALQLRPYEVATVLLKPSPRRAT